MGFLDRLDEVFPGYGAIADLLRGGISEADYERLRSDDRVYEIPPGPVASEATVEIGGRPASFGVAPDWEARSEAELAELQAAEGPPGRVHAQLFRPGSAPEAGGALTVMSFAVSEKEVNSRPVAWALATEQSMGLPASRIARVRIGGGVGQMWHLRGTVEGIRVGQPDQATIPIHSVQLYVPLFGSNPHFLKVLLMVPLAEIDDCLPTLNTLVGSWRWT